MEEWKDIPELIGKYQCSNYGRIRRLNKDKRCQKYKILKLQNTKDGYLSVNPTRDYRKRVHRIVAELFLDNHNNKPIVNHIDCNKKNNYFKNLEWVSYSENSIHAQKNNLLGRNHIILKDIINNVFYFSIKEAAKKNDLNYNYLAKKIKKDGFHKNLIKIKKEYSCSINEKAY